MMIEEALGSGAFPLHVDGEVETLRARLSDVAAGRRRCILFDFRNLDGSGVELDEAFAAILLANAAVMARSQKPVLKLLHTSFDAGPGWPRRLFPLFNYARGAMSGGFADLRNIDLWLKTVSNGSGVAARDLPELQRFLGFFQAVGLSEETGVTVQEAEVFFGATAATPDAPGAPAAPGAVEGAGHFQLAEPSALEAKLTLPDGAGDALFAYDQFRDFGAVRLVSSIDRERSRLVFDFAAGRDAVAEIPALLTHLSDFDLIKGRAR